MEKFAYIIGFQANFFVHPVAFEVEIGNHFVQDDAKIQSSTKISLQVAVQNKLTA